MLELIFSSYFYNRILNLLAIYRQSLVKKTNKKNIPSNNTFPIHLDNQTTVYKVNGTRTVYICNGFDVMNRTSRVPKSVLRYVLDKGPYFDLETVFIQSCFPNKETDSRRRVKQFISFVDKDSLPWDRIKNQPFMTYLGCRRFLNTV